MKIRVAFFILLFGHFAFAQEPSSNHISKTVAVNDSIVLDSVSITSKKFSVLLKDGTLLDSSYYSIDYAKALLQLKKVIPSDSIRVNYLRFPKFLTKTYKQFDTDVIIENNSILDRIYKISQPNTDQNFTPFDGLTTSGSISRGVTIGNNQNSVLNSELDLQITGKLNEKVSLRASIQDANIPLQESGYSQKLDEFDQVFIEVFSEHWNIRAGDIDLENSDSYFASFSKRVQGLSLRAGLDGASTQSEVFAAGALVRGQFTTSQFTAQEGNQGPYKLQGNQGQLFVLIVSGSETVYVNGIALKRGENEDYIIDYNAGEIVFNATFPITSEMRITVDYQFSDRNYSRLVAFGGGNYSSEKLKIAASVYSENDAKNNPLQQNLSEEQVAVLAQAGDDTSLMVAPSSTEEAFNENRILYRKELIGTVEAFVFSNNPDDTLFSVRFTNVGANQGDYILSNINAISNIYEYIAPVLGVSQGEYAPVIQLVSPNKLQMAMLNGSYTPSEKTTLAFEFAASKNDLNLFSTLNDDDNDGFAAKIKLDQTLVKRDSLWNLKAMADIDYINSDFRNIEGLYNPEFNRDWNLEPSTQANQIVSKLGHQALVRSGLELFHHKKGRVNYHFEHLNYSEGFNGNRHIASAHLLLNKLSIQSQASFLSADSETRSSTFLRSSHAFIYSFNKAWLGTRLAVENNKQKDKLSQDFTPLSQKFQAYEVFTGIGDSTQVFAEIGYKYRVNDSLRANKIERVNSSNTYYLKSRLIKNERSHLSLFLNYRILNNTEEAIDDEKSLNSRLQYSQRFFDQLVHWQTVFETNSGRIAQQDFTYIAVEPGEGAYTWIDYNSNGIQELEEFEIAQFQDLGTYIRVLLPNQIFIKTHQNKLSQTLTLNPIKWVNSVHKVRRFWSHFYNQTSYLIDRKTKRDASAFQINPFQEDADNQLGLQLNFRNALFFNRGKQRYTTSYTYLSNAARNELSVGFISNSLKSHQLNFNHKLGKFWLVNLLTGIDKTESESENFVTKNFKIDEERLNPKISYLFNDNTRFDLFYQRSTKRNTIGDLESLDQQKYGFSFAFSPKDGGQNNAISGEFNVFSNRFEGNSNSPVGYQLLEGLQNGKNFTWSLLAQKKITKFLDLNLTYFGRKTETSKTIHTGNVQLKAYF